MAIVQELLSVKADQASLVACGLTATFPMGILSILVFSPVNFSDLDIFKLLLLSFSLTGPLLALVLFCVHAVAFDEERKTPRPHGNYFFISSGLVLSSQCICLFLAFMLHFTLSAYVFTLVAFLMLLLLVVASAAEAAKKDRKAEIMAEQDYQI